MTYLFYIKMTTITERYSDEDEFEALLDRIGLNDTQVNRLQSDGFVSMRMLVGHYHMSGPEEMDKYLRDLNKTFATAARQEARVYYNPVVINRLVGCLSYFIHCVHSFHTIPDISVIKMDDADYLGSEWKEFYSDKKRANTKTSDDDLNVEIPTLKGPSTWVSFRDAFIHKLKDTLNQRGFAISYLVDPTQRKVTVSTAALLESVSVDFSEESIFDTLTIHFGSAFRADNKKMWNMLEGTLLNTDPYNIIAQYSKSKDGRKAWFALKNRYEGEDYIQAVREEAMARLKSTHYRGETRNFKWDNYVSAHVKSHKQLLDVGYNNGSGLDDATKIQFFRSNIVPQADLHVALSVARTYERKTFQDYLTFMTTEVNAMVSRKRQVYQPERRVSSLRNKNNCANKSGGNTQNNHIKRGGRIQLGPPLYETVDGKRLESKHYSKEEFSKLSKSQRQAVINLNRERKKRAWNESKGNDSSNGQHSISAMEAISDDLKSFQTAVVAAISSNNRSIQADRPNANENNKLVVKFDDGSAKSGRIGEFLANARKKAKHVNAYSIVIDSKRKISKATTTNSNNTNLSAQEKQIGCKLGMDSHADISCIGRHARVLEVLEGQTCTVKPFNDSYSPLTNIQTVNAALAIDSPNGETFILKLNNALDFRGSMEDCILCSNQARMQGVIVDDIPKLLHPEGNGTHSLYFPHEKIRFPFSLNGPVSYVQVRYPTDWDLDNCKHLDLTSSDGPWDPSKMMSVQSLGRIIDNKDIHTLYVSRAHKVQGLSRLSDSKQLTPEYLSRLWNITLKDAQLTIQATTQNSIRSNEGIRSKRLKTLPHQKLYRQLSNEYLGKFASDTFFSNVVSLRGNSCVQLFVNRGNFCKSYPMQKKSQAHRALDRFFHEVGVPSELLTDNASEITVGKWGKLCNRHYVKQKLTEPYSPWQNPTELAGGIIKRKMRRMMKLTNTPIRLWDYAWEYVSELRCLTAMKHIYLDGSTPLQKVMGYTPNITEYVLFGWYEWIWYHSVTDVNRTLLGRWLGPASNIGQGMAFYVLTGEAKVIVRSTVSSLSTDEKNSDSVKKQMTKFNENIENSIGNYSVSTVNNVSGEMHGTDIYSNIFVSSDNDLEFEFKEYGEYDEEGNYVKIPEADELYSVKPTSTIFELQNEIEGKTVRLMHGGEIKEGTIEEPSKYHSNTYEVSFHDGSYGEFSTNVLIESLNASEVDNVTNGVTDDIKGIIDHEVDQSVAISKEEGWYVHKGARKRVITTKGWKILVEFADGTTQWFPLMHIKNIMPMELADYAISRKINDQPAFAWWVLSTINKRNKIINAITRVPKKLMKYGIRIPSCVDEALKFDKENNDDLWTKAITKELKNVLIAFRLLDDNESIPVGSRLIPYHIIFDVKSDLTRKARLVAGGHRNQVPAHTTYSSVAGRDSVRIGFLLAALNGLKILACDIGNAYLNAPNRERVHVRVGKELFGPENEGKHAVIDRALYGLKSASAAWRSHFSDTITKVLGYSPSYADNDVYIKARIRSNGSSYYSYLIIYVDDVLCIDANPKEVIDRIASVYRVKENSVEEPKRYLGMDVK